MLANLNYLHILVATVVYFIIGALWYSVLFQKIWMQLVGAAMPTDEDKKSLPKMFAITFVLNFIISASTACVLYFVEPISVIASIKVGLLLGIGFVGTTCAMNYMYSKRPFKLTLIDSSYHIVAITIASIILTLWH